MSVSYPVDLHMHSHFSDGLKSPAELVSMAQKLRLEMIALCDHDTVKGFAPMAQAVKEAARCEGSPLRLIPSVELSCGEESNVHLLGYGVDTENAVLINAMEETRRRRLERMKEMIRRLEAIGIGFSEEALGRLLRPGTGRAHLSRELIGVGLVNTIKQALDRYLGEGRPGYVPLQPISATEGVELLLQAGAKPVLAHPMRLRMTDEARLALMEDLLRHGLAGVEAYHPSAVGRQAGLLEKWGRRNGLLITGGSDYHGDANTTVYMGRLPSGWASWKQDAEALMDACGLE